MFSFEATDKQVTENREFVLWFNIPIPKYHPFSLRIILINFGSKILVQKKFTKPLTETRMLTLIKFLFIRIQADLTIHVLLKLLLR